MSSNSATRRRAVLATLTGLVIAACSSGGGGGGSGGTTGPAALVPTAVAAVGGLTTVAGCGGALVPDTPVVVVRDQNGALLGGATVTFTVTSGGGSLSKTSVTTNQFGQAGVAWTLGTTGSQQMTAKAGSVAPVTYTAALTSTGPYCVELIYTAPPDPVARVAAEVAAARWSSIINAAIIPYVVNDPSYSCAGVTLPPIQRTVKSVLIYVELAPIPSSTPGLITLGQAGPCSIRDSTGLTGVGVLKLNSDYLVNNLSQVQREDVVLHEMGHVLGFGTLWEPITGVVGLPTLLVNPAPTGNPQFVGANAVTRYIQAGAAAGVTQVPVENCGGGGTINGHWREASGGSAATVGFGIELMTGYISAPAGQHNPLSAVTIASMQDMGYPVSYASADPFTAAGQTCPATLVAASNLTQGLVRVGNDWVSESLQLPLRVGGRGGSRPIFR
ncbi:MAG: hypothetical protein HY275_03605 [Gemmatimonadetes bacterium]|nr:hypothetical protein [Gemmatimonadota bacterium]